MKWLNRNALPNRSVTGNTSLFMVWAFNFWVHRKLQQLMFDDISMMKSFTRSRALRTIALMVLVLPGFGGRSLLCQALPASIDHAQPTTPVVLRDLTLPEAQPRLDIDRDPVPSPDPEIISPVSETSPLVPAGPDEIQKSQDGHYNHAQRCG